MKSSAKQLYNLEKEKIAVDKDYDTAKQLKLQIEQLRAMSLNVEPSKSHAPQPIYQQQQPQFIKNNNQCITTTTNI